MTALPQYAKNGAPVNRRRRGPAPIAPMPTDPTTCRWCGSTLHAVLDFEPADCCNNSCAKNDQHPYTADCQDCGREFQTGRRRAVLCYECEQADQRDTAAVTPTIPKHEMALKKDYSRLSGRKRG